MAARKKSDLQRVLDEMPFAGGAVNALDIPEVQEWLRELAALRATRGYSYEYMAKVLTRLATDHGYTTHGISETTVRRRARETASGAR